MYVWSHFILSIDTLGHGLSCLPDCLRLFPEITQFEGFVNNGTKWSFLANAWIPRSRWVQKDPPARVRSAFLDIPARTHNEPVFAAPRWRLCGRERRANKYQWTDLRQQSILWGRCLSWSETGAVRVGLSAHYRHHTRRAIWVVPETQAVLFPRLKKEVNFVFCFRSRCCLVRHGIVVTAPPTLVCSVTWVTDLFRRSYILLLSST